MRTKQKSDDELRQDLQRAAKALLDRGLITSCQTFHICINPNGEGFRQTEIRLTDRKLSRADGLLLEFR